ncbi:hypothetical protein [Microtetraspora malaysiensis]
MIRMRESAFTLPWPELMVIAHSRGPAAGLGMVGTSHPALIDAAKDD